MKFKVIRLCKQEAMSIVPMEVVRYDLQKAAGLLERGGYSVTPQGPMIIARKGEVEATLYTNGRMLVSKVESREEAGEIATAVYEAVGGATEPLPSKKS